MDTVRTDREMAQLGVDVEMIQHQRAPPPPYTVSEMPRQAPITNSSVIHQTIFVQQPLKNVPVYYNCPRCHKTTLTSVQFVNSHKTHMLAGFICGLTMWCMLCCLATIPYACSNFQKADHYCSNCKVYLGSYSKL